MKKVLLIVLVLTVAFLAYFIIQRQVSNKAILSITTTDGQVAKILADNNCAACHSVNAQEPFYASFPIIGKVVKEDMKIGVKAFNLDKAYDSKANLNFSEVDLAKVEYSMSYGQMPPLKYYGVHWHSALSKVEKEIITSWVEAKRKEFFATGLNNDEFVNEPIQAMVASLETNSAKVELGEILYHDVRLSKNNTVSCATCHDLAAGGDDGLQFSKGIYDQIGGINAPTVYNSAFNLAQFWDGRAADLQAQAGGPPFDALEMGNTSWDEVIVKLNDDKKLRKQFKTVYPDGFTGDNITDAIAEFEKTLITPDSKFDKYLKGDKGILSDNEKLGYELFKENKCATCHVGQALGGQSYEHISVFEDYFANREMKADREIIRIKDQGHFNATNNEADRGLFKTPILRNLPLTAPYFHDGTVLTMEDAVKLMFRYELGEEASDDQVDRIVDFLKTI